MGFGEELGFMNSSVYVDGVDQGNTLFSLDTKINRPELKQKYPQYNNSEKSGFKYKLDTTKFKNGQHKIKFCFVGVQKEILFNIENGHKAIEVKADKDSGIINFNGYILSDTKVINLKNCKVYLDNECMNNALKELVIGLKSPELKQKYPQFKNTENAGFSYTLDSRLILNGYHKISFDFSGIKIEEYFIVLNNSVVNEKEKEKEKVLEVNADGEEGIISFTGYVLGLSEEISFMNSSVYVDGVDQRNTLLSLETKINRPELKQKYSQYNNAEDSGFRYKLDTTKLKNGQHKIKFCFTGIQKEITFNVKNKAKIIEFDNVTSEEGIINFTGYVLGLSEEISFMNSSVYVDGVEVDQGNTLLSLETKVNRPELKQKYSQYNNAENSGFRYKLDTTKLKNGQHKIKFNFKGNEKEVIYNVNNKKPVLEFESVKEKKRGLMEISGYYFSSFDQRNKYTLKVFIDGKIYDSCLFSQEFDIDSKDLLDKYPEYKNHNTNRFKYLVNITKLNNGKHTIKFVWPEIENSIVINVNNMPNTKPISDEDIMLNNDLQEGFKEINAALNQINAGLNQMNASLNQINATIDKMIAALNQINEALNQMNAGLDRINLFVTQAISIINDCNANMDKMLKGVAQARNGTDRLLKMKANAEALNDQSVKELVDEYNKQLEELQQKQEDYNSKWYNQLWEYIKASGKQVVMGKYTDSVTYLGTFGEFGIGIFDLDIAADIRDLSYDIQYWEFSWSHAGETTLDAIGVLPIVGIIKYGDEARILVKNGEKYEVKKIIGGTSEANKALNGLQGFKTGITSDEIKEINKRFGGATELNGSIDTILDSASRYDGFWNKTAAITRSIVKNHTFDNGNKRTAQAVIEILMSRNGVSTGVSQTAMKDIIYKISIGQLNEVEDIAKALRGF